MTTNVRALYRKEGVGVNTPTPVDAHHQDGVLPEGELRIIDFSIESVVTSDVSQTDRSGLPIPLTYYMMPVDSFSLLDRITAEEARSARLVTHDTLGLHGLASPPAWTRTARPGHTGHCRYSGSRPAESHIAFADS